MSVERSAASPALEWLPARGSPAQIGRILGERGRDAVHRHLLPSRLWRTLTGSAFASRVAALSAATRERHPAIWQELEGMADGLGLPVADVAAWNCRGDLLASSPDGCTTVWRPGSPHVIAHNEDGLPFFEGHCLIVEATPDDAPAFVSFCYPGSLMGHTFGFNASGVTLTVNNLRLRGVDARLPRMVLTRALMTAETLDQALSMLARPPASGGFHVTLAQRGDDRLLSVEFGDGHLRCRAITSADVHANHALDLPTSPCGQIITASSRDRQRRGSTLAARPGIDALSILHDASGSGLPIHRDAPDDPDHENTLASFVVHVGREALHWSIHEPRSEAALYRGEATVEAFG